MKKSILASAIVLVIAGSAFAQPVSDRAVVPIGVTLVQILRIHVTNGGNIEFVFNDINDYKNGIANGGFYDTDFTVAASTDWTLHMGAENATFLGTDNPANTLPLNFVGFILGISGTYTIASTNLAMAAAYLNSNATANGLAAYTGVAATDGLITKGVLTNAGDVLNNIFTINWQSAIFPVVGAGTTATNAVSMLTQSPVPDRYTTNVFLELEAI